MEKIKSYIKLIIAYIKAHFAICVIGCVACFVALTDSLSVSAVSTGIAVICISTVLTGLVLHALTAVKLTKNMIYGDDGKLDFSERMLLAGLTLGIFLTVSLTLKDMFGLYIFNILSAK